MKIIAPTLDIDKEASVDLITELTPLLQNREYPFLILESTDLTYIQILWCREGYLIEFQENSIEKHYIMKELLNTEETIKLLIQYLNNEFKWNGVYEVSLKNIRGFWGGLGYKLGLFIGSLLRGHKESKAIKP